MERLINFRSKSYYYLCYFIAYSFIGWCIETIYVSTAENKFVNRGFIYGPFCIMYGFAALFLLLVLQPIKKNALITFAVAVVFTTLLEYVTGFILETAFHAKWWDYSNETFNFKGRICLKFSLVWGIVSMIFLTYIHPAIHTVADIVPYSWRTFVLYLILFYIVTDFTVSVIAFTGCGILLQMLQLFFPVIVLL